MITIYERDATDFSANGLGTLNPTSCTVSETMNGSFEVTLIHPIDEAGKFRRIQEERIVKVPVPAGRTPRIAMSAAAETLRIYKVVTDGRRLYLRAAPSQSAKGIHAYKPGTEVVVIDNTTNSQWSEVETPDGRHGWMWTGNLSYVRTETTGEAVNSIKEAANLREQPFRIYKVVPTLTGVTAYARHVFYDLMDNMISSYKPGDSTTGAAAFIGLSGVTEDGHEFTFYSDVDSTAEGVEIIDKNPAEAILDDGGIIESYGGELMRDWWDVYLAKRIGEETGIQIREGKNLLGISYAIDITNTVTRVIPKGEDEDGNPLYLDGRYRENTAEDKPVYANHKYGIIEVKEAKVKNTGDDKRTKAECIELMEKAAIEAFEAGCDLPDVTLNVDFIDCTETEEYRQYKFLQGIHMGDTVKVIAKRVGVEVAMRMTQYVYDCLQRKYTKMTLGTIDATIEGNMINPRSIGSGTITGSMIKLGSVGTGALADGAVNGLKIALAAIDYAHIGQAAIDQLAVNAVTAIRAEIRDLVAGNITTDQLYADLAYIAAAQITAANIDKANIQWAEIESLTAEIAKVANAEIAKADIEWAQIRNVEIEAADIADLTATVADIVRAEVAEIKIGTAQIEDAAITSAKIALGAITAALIENGAIGTAQIADGSITEAKIVSLNADVITAGTLSVERLLIKGPDGLFRAINATDEGLTAAELDSETYQSALSGTVLVARSVTADKIAAKSITANEILSGTITAAEIDVTNLFAAQATIAALDSYIMRTTTIEALEGSLDVWAEEKIALRIAGKADQSDVDALGDRMTEAESEIIQQAGSISANATAIETVSQSANAAQDAADAAQNTANAAQNTANAAQSAADAAQGSADANADNLTKVASRVTTAEANISALEGEIETKVSQTDFNALGGRVSTAESAITLNADQIETKVSQTDFNALGGRVSTAETAIEQNSTDIVLLAGRTVGGTNYLLDSGVEISNSAYHIADYYFSDALKPKAGETVTIRIWGTLGTGRTQFGVYNTNGYIQIGMLTDNGDGTHSGTFTWRTVNENYPDYSHTDETQTHVQIYARPNSTAITSISTIEKIKLEIGNTATDWSAHPEELNAGSSVRINEKGVYISGGEIEMQTTSGDEYLHITGSGIDASSLSAPNVTPRYDGPATLYVNPNATSAQIAAGNYYRSLADAAAAINYKWIDKGITINLAAGMVEYGTVTFRGAYGGNWITIKGDSTKHAKLVGKLIISIGMCHVSVQYLDIDSPVNQRAIDVSGGYADISYCVITGKGTATTVNGATNSSSIGILAEQGARVVTGSCEIYDVYRSLYTQTAGQLQSSNNKGNCTVGTNRTHMFVSGTAPCASTSWTYSEVAGGKVWTSSDVTVNQGSKPTAEAEPTTVNYNFTYADSYAGGWSYFEDADARQGYVNGRRIYGTIWFNASAIKTALAGKTIKQASLRLYMQSGVGRGVSVSVQMYGTNMAYDGRSGAPALTTSYGTIGSTAPGQLNEITIPTQVIADIVNGTIQALVLYSDDTDYYSGRSYSKNYARFDGSTSGDSSTRPRLTVVYS